MRDMDVALLAVIAAMLPEEEESAEGEAKNIEIKKTTKKGGSKK